MEFWPPRYVVLGGIRGNLFRLRRADFWHMSFYMESGEIFFRLRQADKKNLTSLGSYGFFSGIKRFGHICRFRWNFYSRQHLKNELKILMNSAARMAFLGTQTICDICYFWWNLTSPICRFRWNFSFSDRFRRNFRFPRCVVFDGISATTCILCSNISYLKQFSSASRRANKKSFLYWRILGISISYQNIFWRPTPDKKCRFWWNLGGTNMSFWVEFGEIQYVVLDGILPKIKN